MFSPSGTRPATGSLKLLAIIGAIFTTGFIIYQISFLHAFVLPSNISEPLDALRSCHRHKPTLNHYKGPRSSSKSGVPNIIHQIWKTSNVSEYSDQPSHRSWQAVYQPLNYTVKLWTDDGILDLIRVKYPWLLSTYVNYPHNIQRADLARLVVVHAEGGVYADLDVYPRSVEELQCFQRLGMQAIFAPTAGTMGVSNHFFMAEKESPFLRWALDEAKRRAGLNSNQIVLPYLRVFWSTGPMMVTAAALQYAAVRGENHRLAVIDDRFVRTLVGHAAGRSWHGADGQFLNFIGDYHKAIGLGFGAIVLFALIVVVTRLVYIRRRNRDSAEYKLYLH
ncbi:hypothetical protein TWF506_009184 [Arthrobotrys conoides]|uniref:Uncharacterized protein n=1 Tax=Arthrobotrys conoides TaxID=74498 RepID=A0AAN8NC15_9PEZI